MNPFTRSILLTVPFSALVTGLFNLGEFLPWPVAVLAGAAWGVLLALLGSWIGRRPRRRTGAENVLLAAGVTGFAFAGCGGLMAILLEKGALNSPSLTGETLEQLFLPSIPYYIVTNGLLETLIVPLLVVVGWRPGRRRLLIVAAACLYFAMRIWTYLVFVPARMGWADSGHSGQSLTPAERAQAASDLMLDDPRWAMVLLMFGLLLSATFLRSAGGDAPRRHTEGSQAGDRSAAPPSSPPAGARF